MFKKIESTAMDAWTEHSVCLVPRAWRMTAHSGWVGGGIGLGTTKTLHDFGLFQSLTAKDNLAMSPGTVANMRLRLLLL